MLLNILYRGTKEVTGEIVTGYAVKNLIGNIVIHTDGLQQWACLPGSVSQMICFDKNGKPVFPGDSAKQNGQTGVVYFDKYETSDNAFIPAWCVGNCIINFDANLVAKDLELLDFNYGELTEIEQDQLQDEVFKLPPNNKQEVDAFMQELANTQSIKRTGLTKKVVIHGTLEKDLPDSTKEALENKKEEYEKLQDKIKKKFKSKLF